MTYAIAPGSELRLSVDGGVWQTATFMADDFDDPDAATADEIAAVLNRVDHLAARADGDAVVLETTTVGTNASVEIDPSSTAAGALGLTQGQLVATGSGLQAPRLVSMTAEPFALEEGAELALVRNGRKRRVEFKSGFTAGAATAAEVARVLNGALKGVARITRDGRVMLLGSGVGPDASLEVQPAGEEAAADAATALGFVGAAGISHPHRSEPARMTLSGGAPSVVAVSLSAGPFELLFPTGAVQLAPRGSVPLSTLEAADPQVQRLVQQGVLRLAGGGGDA